MKKPFPRACLAALPLALILTLTACGSSSSDSLSEDTASLAETDLIDTDTAQGTPADSSDASHETAASAALTESVADTGEADGDTDNTDTQTDDASDAISYSGYGCTVWIPAGWEATEGASGGMLTDNMSLFQPVNPNGDSIALDVEDEAEDEDAFAALTALDLAYAYGEALETVSVESFSSVTVDGCPGYAMTLSGTVENITVTIRQLIVNRPDKNRFYSLTYSNYSGEESVYPQSLDYYFSLT